MTWQDELRAVRQTSWTVTTVDEHGEPTRAEVLLGDMEYSDLERLAGDDNNCPDSQRKLELVTKYHYDNPDLF